MPLNANRAITLRDAERIALAPAYSCAHEIGTADRFAWLAWPDRCDGRASYAPQASTRNARACTSFEAAL